MPDILFYVNFLFDGIIVGGLWQQKENRLLRRAAPHQS